MIINRLDNNLLIEEGIFSILPSSSRTANKWLLIVLHRFEFFINWKYSFLDKLRWSWRILFPISIHIFSYNILTLESSLFWDRTTEED